MAFAIVQGIIRGGLCPAGDVFVCDVDSGKYAAFEQLGAVPAKLDVLMRNADVIFFSIKPQNFEQVLQDIREYALPEKLFVSIAAGISVGYIEERLGHPCKVVRCMPNTPLMLGVGATAISPSAGVTDEELGFVRSLFETIGIVEQLPEDRMNEVIAVNGSSPAYVYLFIESLLEGAAQLGIEREMALRLICQTIDGSVKMVRESGKSPEELIKMVSSPGGTTLKALEALEAGGFKETLIKAMHSCTQRARELGQ